MKKSIIYYGLISGLIVSATLILTTSLCYNTPDFQDQGSMYVGFGGIIIAFSMIFIGVKNFRDKHNDGVITFGKAFKLGFYIALIASTMYVAVWLIEYYAFMPDFMDKYAAHELSKIHSGGYSQAEISDKIADMNSYKEMYKNPAYIVLLTYMEILPLGLVLSLISALIFKKKINGNLAAD